MDGALGLIVASVAAFAVGVLATYVVLRRRAGPHADTARLALERDDVPSPNVPEGLGRLLAVLPGAAFVVGADDGVLRASTQSAALGVVQGRRLDIPEIRALVAAVRRDGVIREEDLELRRPPLGKGVIHARVRVATLSPTAALVIVEDLSEALRLDAVRRDFVANVSHELKTPVGALSLLAEAVQSASDDPEAVQRFSARMQVESRRLTNLMNDLVDLSRLQGAEVAQAEPVEVDRVVAEAVDATKLLAGSRDIEVVIGSPVGAVVLGSEAQLVMALRNLLTNAIAYSPTGTRVVVAARRGDQAVEIGVTDQGIGIPEGEQARIFERFYRVDPARSRITGGTGLGLAIVKHVCVNHGGECTVWSVEGEGSTFTLRLPLAPAGTTEGDTPQ
ncbi:sensor histidine kinase [Longivirga aurantiaca]|uniref:Sensor-like histidine kinase SenX3 n=1 Tax=Longivirga aurantiaca TaxID=1837743 RepID=A0ABW1SXH4_9ACTN